MRSRTTVLAWIVLYLLLTSGIVWWLVRLREAQLQMAHRPEVRAQWEAWKEAVQRDNAAPSQPVARRTPNTSEPPGMILLRDHFTAVGVTLWLVWTAFFGFLAMVTTGVLRGSPRVERSTENL